MTLDEAIKHCQDKIDNTLCGIEHRQLRDWLIELKERRSSTFIFNKNLMNKIIDWFKASNRWKHLLGGVLIGIGANDVYCAAYAGIGVASALELKDKLWGGKPDFIDWALTVVGVAAGYASRFGVLQLF